jgi:hypothetical protein
MTTFQEIWERLIQSPVAVGSPVDNTPIPYIPESSGELIYPALKDQPKQPTVNRDLHISEMPLTLLKGQSIKVFADQSANLLSDVTIEMLYWNGLHVDVWVSGTNPSATITVKGADEVGNYLTLPDTAATQTTVNADKSFDVIVHTRLAKINISSISGTFTASTGFTITVTPYRA